MPMDPARVLADAAVSALKAERHLPTKADKVEGWRESAGFDVGQVVKLTTSAKLSETDRRFPVILVSQWVTEMS